MDETNFIDLFLARCWHWDRQLKLHAPTPESAALAMNEAILIAESRNTKPLKGKTMNQVKLTETQNSYIVEMGDTSSHFLKTNPRAHQMALQQVEEYKHAANSAPELVTNLLRGRDSMLVPIEELEELSRFGGAVGNYIHGIIHARRSLQAAGVEVPA